MKKIIALSLLIAFSFQVNAGSIVVHPSNASSLDMDEIKKIFLGKSKSFPGGGSAVAISQEEGTGPTDTFNKTVLNKSASQLKSYWAKLVFTGKATPPKAVANDAEVIGLISSNPNMIGYIEGEADGSVKVVATY